MIVDFDFFATPLVWPLRKFSASKFTQESLFLVQLKLNKYRGGISSISIKSLAVKLPTTGFAYILYLPAPSAHRHPYYADS